MTYIVGHFIQGKIVSATGKETFPLYNPATGEIIGHTKFASSEDINHAVTSAEEAFPSWAATPAVKRARVLFKFRQLLEENISELAVTITREHGKTLEDAKGSVLRGIELVEFACSTPNLLKGGYSQNVASGVDCYTTRSPLGVCVGITPFNFPVMVPIWMFAWAIACGNTFILKPSEQDPSSSLILAELLRQAGLPAGVFNVLQGNKTTVDELIQHPSVKAVSAVASSKVAESIYQIAITHGKRAHTFGGAKNHCVVMKDADPLKTAQAIIGSAFGSAGERCMATPVVVAVGDDTADRLIEQFKDIVPKLRLGPGSESTTEIGPLISAAHKARVLNYIDLGIKQGAELIIDGRNISVPGHQNGFFLGACIFDNVTAKMTIYQEEIFGPVLSIVRVPDLQQAIDLASQHPYGNGTAIFTENGGAAQHFAAQVEVGMVGINVPIPVPVAFHSFGGWKQSFFGDIGMHGDQSVQFYTKLKTITARWQEKDWEFLDLSMTAH